VDLFVVPEPAREVGHRCNAFSMYKPCFSVFLAAGDERGDAHGAYFVIRRNRRREAKAGVSVPCFTWVQRGEGRRGQGRKESEMRMDGGSPVLKGGRANIYRNFMRGRGAQMQR